MYPINQNFDNHKCHCHAYKITGSYEIARIASRSSRIINANSMMYTHHPLHIKISRITFPSPDNIFAVDIFNNELKKKMMCLSRRSSYRLTHTSYTLRRVGGQCAAAGAREVHKKEI